MEKSVTIARRIGTRAKVLLDEAAARGEAAYRTSLAAMARDNRVPGDLLERCVRFVELFDDEFVAARPRLRAALWLELTTVADRDARVRLADVCQQSAVDLDMLRRLVRLVRRGAINLLAAADDTTVSASAADPAPAESASV